MRHSSPRQGYTALLWLALFVPVVYVALYLAAHTAPGAGLIAMLSVLEAIPQRPFDVTWTALSPKAVLISIILYGLALSAYYATQRNEHRGEEHGTARWGMTAALRGKYRDGRHRDRNIILTRNVHLGMNTRKHRRNLNVLVIGGSGAGKTRFYCKPNIMQCACSYIVTDPKGEQVRATGHLLRQQGYDVKVLDLINMDNSDCYNPFAYLESDEDVFRLITNLIRNTTPPNSSNQDPFWEKSETALVSALFLYLKHEALPEEQNFATVMYLIEHGDAKEDSDDFISPLDILFDDLEFSSPEHIAVKEYKIFKQAAGKTAKSILLSAAVRLTVFNLPKLQAITSSDNLDIGRLGERKQAIFAVIPDNDGTFNFLVGMLYTQAFQALYRSADFEHGGRLPVPVHLILDEFANTANLPPDDFLRVLATMRSREISVSIILQNLAQLKKQFEKDAWESVVGNCDSLLFLGGNEAGTHEYLSKMLGKSTIDTRTSGQTKGKQGSYTQNYQNAGRELMTPDEVRRMDNSLALLFIRGEPPVLDEKYDILKHPNAKYTEDGGAAPYRHKLPIPEYLTQPIRVDLDRAGDYEIV